MGDGEFEFVYHLKSRRCGRRRSCLSSLMVWPYQFYLHINELLQKTDGISFKWRGRSDRQLKVIFPDGNDGSADGRYYCHLVCGDTTFCGQGQLGILFLNLHYFLNFFFFCFLFLCFFTWHKCCCFCCFSFRPT